MDLQKVKQKLDKVNRFYDFLTVAPESISSLDRDSFMTLIRELYEEVVLGSPVIQSNATPKVEPIKEVTPPKVEPKTEPKEEPIPVQKTPKLVFTQPEEPIEKVVEKKEEPKVEPKTEKVVEPVLPKEEPKVVEEPRAIEKTAPKVEELPTEVVEPKVSTESKEEFDELFVFKIATELIDKLKESPISNLNSAIGLNDKMHYMSQLFGGDAGQFKFAIDHFNSVSNFDQARVYMEDKLIDRYNWLHKEKKTLAKEFIKLVRRRYL